MFRLTARGHRLTAEEQALIYAEAVQLEQDFPRLTDCHVIVAVLHRNANGGPVAVAFRLALTVGDGELAVSRPARPSFHEALVDAMASARRQLRELANGSADHPHPAGV